MSTFSKFEEYRLFIEDTARFSERRQTVSSTFVAVNMLLLTAIAFLVKDSGARYYGALVTALPIPLVIAGILVCIWWRQLIFKYKTLVDFRMKQLMEMEALPEMQGCHQMYLKEREELYKRDAQGRKVPAGRLNFSELESRLPALFIVLYALFGLFLILALAWQMWRP
jgi:hypothetical protein